MYNRETEIRKAIVAGERALQSLKEAKISRIFHHKIWSNYMSGLTHGSTGFFMRYPDMFVFDMQCRLVRNLRITFGGLDPDA